jgi:hypothetical protein
MSATMIVVPRTAIADAQFVSSTVAENDHTAWNAGTTYGDGDRCILTSTHRIYESVLAANTNHNPATDDGTWWIDVGPTNRWAMFDDGVSTQTTAALTFTAVITPGVACDTIALINITGATEAEVVMTHDSVEVFSATLDLLAPVSDWEEYFFDPIEIRSEAIVYGLPLYANGEISATLTGGGTVGLGVLAVGRAVDLGLAQYGVQVGIVDYSTKETDVFGNTVIVERPFKKRYDVNCVVENTRLDIIAKKLAALRAQPSVWAASDQYDALVAYGFFKDWQVEIAYFSHSHLSLNIEGLI